MSPLAGSVADPGLQPERTALAWRRTALALTAGSVATGRILLPLLDAGSYLLSALGLAAGIGLWLAADRRYRALHSALTATPSGTAAATEGTRLPVAAGDTGQGLRLPSVGGLALGCTLCCLCCGLGALALLLFPH